MLARFFSAIFVVFGLVGSSVGPTSAWAQPAAATPPNSTVMPTEVEDNSDPATTKSPASTPAVSEQSDLPASDSEEISLEEWNRDDWMLLKPKLALFEIDGYFRFRTGMLRKLDFNNSSRWETQARYPDIADDLDPYTIGRANFSSADMRLRLEPQINITETIQVNATFDVLDNLVLGSTPDTLPLRDPWPLNAMSRQQTQPLRNINSVSDAIFVRRVWARMTALNEQLELRVGRMPDHWGLGMLANSGDCLDCDFGHTVDRAALSFKAANHIFTPMFDWVSTGPALQPFGSGTNLDQVVWDDAVQYGLRIARQDHPDDIEARLLQGETVVNYGLWNTLRTQNRDISPAGYNYQAPNPNATDEAEKAGSPAEYPSGLIARRNGIAERRDALVYQGDAYLRIHRGRGELALEGAIVAGRFNDSALGPTVDAAGGLVDPTQRTNVLQWGAALEAKYRLQGDYTGTQLALKGGVASADSAPGYGALNFAGTQRGPGDRTLNNFQFSPDYHVDLLMFRRIIGTVTDAFYVRPEVSYTFDKKMMGRLAAIYSQAMSASSTAACIPNAQGVSACTANKKYAVRPMGVELDAELSYGMTELALKETGLRASIAGGIAFPLGGFNNPAAPDGAIASNDPANPTLKTIEKGGSFAWTLLGRLYLTF